MENIKSISTLTILKIVGAILGITYSVIQVQYFGTSRDIEIYFAATATTYVLFSLSQSGTLAEIFLPIYIKIKTEYGKEAAHNGFSVVVTRMAAYIIVLCTLAYFFAPFLTRLVVPGFEEESQEQVTAVFRVMCFLLFPQIISSFFIVILNSEKIFGRAEMIGLFRILLNLIVLVTTYSYLGLWSLVISLCAGQIITFFIYIFLLNKNGINLSLRFKASRFDHVSFFKSIYYTLFYVGGTQFYSIVFNSVLSALPQGYFAVFKYVQALSLKAQGIISTPMLIVFFTNFSIAFQKKAENLQEIVKRNTSFIFLFTSIAILLITCYGDFVIEVLWGGKKFDKKFIQPSYEILVFNFIAMLVASLGYLYKKIVISIGLSKQGYIGWGCAQIFTGICVYFLITTLREDGLKYVILLGQFNYGLVGWLLVSRKLPEIAYAFDLKRIAKILFLVLAILPVGLYFKSFGYSWHWVENNRISLLISTIFLGIGVVFTLCISGYIFRVPEVLWVVEKIKYLRKKYNFNRGISKK